MALDPAIAIALSLDPATTKVETHGHSGFTSTFKITTFPDHSPRTLFLKTGVNAAMFSGEHESLNAIHAVVPSLCPQSLAYGKLSNSTKSFLVTDFVEVGKGNTETGTGQSLAQKLAKLHNTLAPNPPGWNKPAFGFPVSTFCGSTMQENSYRASWADFYADNRLRAIGNLIQSNHGFDGAFASLLEKTAGKVVPRLLGDGHIGGKNGIIPVLVHGDLWSGNKFRGSVSGKGGMEELIFDPSSCYAHSEYELGIMRMFGGFSKTFLEEYHHLVPKTEPVTEYEDRIHLYELYHHLNHYAIFGSGYKESAVGIMKKLCRKYGGD